MSIALSMRFTRHSWAMPQTPGFPQGVWSASADDEGDLSGGLISFQHIFRNQSNNLGDTNFYNIEHMMVATQDVAQQSARMQINGMDPGTGQPATPLPVDRVYRLDLNDCDVGSGFDSALNTNVTTHPIWVGTYAGPDTDLGDVIVAAQNIDSIRVLVVLYGYFWAPDAINAPGGIQRPANGLWRS